MDRFRLAVFNTQPPHLYRGGVERRIIETTKRLTQQADISVYCGTKAGFKTPICLNGVNLVPYNSTDRLFPLDNWTFNRTLTKQAPTIQADVFEAHAVSGYDFPRTLKKRGINKPFIHTVHGVLADEYAQAKQNGYSSLRGRLANYFMAHLAKLEEQTAKKATVIVTISQYSLEKIQENYQVDASKVRIVPNGVDTEKYQPMPNQAAAKKPFGLSDEPVVLFVGSLIPRKGLPYLIEAAKKVIAENKQTKFVIVGQGPQKLPLTSAIEKANLTSNFQFIPHVAEEQFPALYNCADVFALPSIQEGQGIVLLEAQACSKPIVAFNIGGVNEAVRSGETGFLVTPQSSIEFADALLKLLDDKKLQQKMGNAGRNFVTQNFTWDICAQKMLSVYREALGN
jgi:glycosyltransferase involved in cell wall biosynthesis